MFKNKKNSWKIFGIIIIIVYQHVTAFTVKKTYILFAKRIQIVFIPRINAEYSINNWWEHFSTFSTSQIRRPYLLLCSNTLRLLSSISNHYLRNWVDVSKFYIAHTWKCQLKINEKKKKKRSNVPRDNSVLLRSIKIGLLVLLIIYKYKKEEYKTFEEYNLVSHTVVVFITEDEYTRHQY